MKKVTIYLQWTIIILVFCPIFLNPLFCMQLPQNVIYLHPKPNAVEISWKTGIILRIDPALQNRISLDDFTFTVTGKVSGNQNGRLVLSENNVLFQLSDAYEPGEKVNVTIECEKLGWTEPYSYEFSVNKLTEYSLLYGSSLLKSSEIPSSASQTTVGKMTTINGVTVPADFPLFEAEILTDEIAPGKIFINNWDGTPYIIIFENDGTPYFYQRVECVSRDFKIQPNRELSRNVGDRFVVMDSSCTIKRTLYAGNGYLTDEHELQILPDGHYFLIAVGNRKVDMSQIVAGGQKNTIVKDNIIQEFDENGNVIFEWLCYEYLNIADAIHQDLTAASIDYLHMNSVAIDYDDNIIVSSRHLSEITKINRQTGDIIWRLGGVRNQFTFTNDNYQLSYQHDARPVSGKPNYYTIFDNGNLHDPRFSRAVEFKLDTEQMTATKVWEYILPSGSTGSMGSAQRLANGNTLINWSYTSLPKATEVTPDGEVVYQADFVNSTQTYRTFRFEWEHAVEKPYLIIENLPSYVNLIFNKFGDTTVKKYQIFAGEEGESLEQIGVTSNTFYQLTKNDLGNNKEYSFCVKAVHEDGTTSQSSNTETVLVTFIETGENLIENGDFSDGYESWNWSVAETAEASRSIDSDGQLKFTITEGGSKYAAIQALQKNIPMINGLTYVFEFDAYADEARPFEAKIVTDGEPYTNYGKIELTALTRRKKHYEYEFTMEDASDTQARVVLNAGYYDANVYIDNVSLIMTTDVSVAPEPGNTATDFELYQNYPNPFNPTTTIYFNIPTRTHVTIKIHNIMGEEINDLTNKIYSVGRYSIEWNGEDKRGFNVPSGIYFYSISTDHYKQTRKMTLIR